MKLYKKLTIINTSLGITVCIIILLIYFFINSLIGIPLLGLFLGGTILHVFIVLLVNLAGIFSIFYIKNTRIVGIALIIYGTLLFSYCYLFWNTRIYFICYRWYNGIKRKTSSKRIKMISNILKRDAFLILVI